MLGEKLKAREIGEIWDQSIPWDARQKQLKELIAEYEYGKLQGIQKQVTWTTLCENTQAFSGKATLREIRIETQFEAGNFTFPCTAVIPHAENPVPFFVLIHFGKPGWEIPMEELIDNGFGLLTFCYQDVAPDGAGQESRAAGDTLKANAVRYLYDGQEMEYGYINAWAWGASRVLDYAMEQKELDCSRAAVVGHSRLGKTALCAGVSDSRFAYVFANDSGCGGAALYRGCKGEQLTDVARNFPHWMCRRYQEYAEKEQSYPLDQHMVLAAIAPRYVYVSAADEDVWADCESMFLACAAASEVYEKLGYKGLVCPDRLPQTGEAFQEGKIGFHLRKGPHDMGREDWNYFMKYMKLHG